MNIISLYYKKELRFYIEKIAIHLILKVFDNDEYKMN